MLYNKYRPQTFAEVVGQDSSVAILQAATSSEHPPHAYLLCGPPGTGKTTLARLTAKALNGDLHERNAAYYGGIEFARELIRWSALASWDGKDRTVYLLDEAHRITPEAQNAFLQLFEEPLAHWFVVLATTEPERILATIVSRCIRIDLKPIAKAVLLAELERIAEAEGYSIDERTLVEIVSAAGGDFRKALTELEKAGLTPGVRTVSPRQQKPQKKKGRQPVIGQALGRPTSEAKVRAAVDKVLADGQKHSFTEIQHEAQKHPDTVRKTLRQMKAAGDVQIDAVAGVSWSVWKTP